MLTRDRDRAGYPPASGGPVAAEVAEAPRRRVWPLPGQLTRTDAVIISVLTLAALVVTSPLWHHPHVRYLPITDQYGFEWLIATVTDAVVHLHNPLFTDNLNAPLGVNLMAQTSIIGLTIPLIPVTLLFGPAVTFVLLLTIGFAGTAVAWYWVLSRHVVRSRISAAIAGGFCGFAPPMMSHAGGGHVNYVVLFLLPFIAWRVVVLGTPGRWLRNGLILGVLVAWQVLIGEEPLLVGALGIAVFVIAYALMDRAGARTQVATFAAGLGVAAATALILVGYPLWFQFAGPQSYGAIPHAAAIGNNVFSLTTFASQSIGGTHPVGYLAYNPTEENGFFGWPLLALATVIAIWLWRQSVAARAAAITAASLLVLSLGVHLSVGSHETHIPLPWRLFTGVPLVGSILPARLVFGAIPAIGLLLALATDRVLAAATEAERTGLPVRLLWFGAVAAVLLPIVPTRIEVYERPPVPAFFSSGQWLQYAAPGHTIVAVPPPGGGADYQMTWQVAAGMRFNHIEGYFIGPWGVDKHGWYGVETPRPTSRLLARVAGNGKQPTITDTQRSQAREDLRYWHADAVVLDPTTEHADELRRTLDDLLGPGTSVGGVWAWDVRALVTG